MKKLSFYDRLLAVTLGPVIVVIGLGAAAVAYRLRGDERGNARAARCVDSILKLLFFVFSSTSTSIFQAFACDDQFDDGRRVLACDYSISCKTPKWRAFRAYAVVCVFVYPIGIVCLFTTLLVKSRSRIDPPLGETGSRRAGIKGRRGKLNKNGGGRKQYCERKH